MQQYISLQILYNVLHAIHDPVCSSLVCVCFMVEGGKVMKSAVCVCV